MDFDEALRMKNASLPIACSLTTVELQERRTGLLEKLSAGFWKSGKSQRAMPFAFRRMTIG